jgi:hypothetical protein
MVGQPGSHYVVIGQAENAIQYRKQGLQLRDTVLILLPGPKEVFAFLFRQPLEGTVAQNVLKQGVGGLWIDGCRVSTSTQDALAMDRCNTPKSGRMYASNSPIGTFIRSNSSGALDTTKGRWPTNLLLVHGPGCVREGEKRVKGDLHVPERRGSGSHVYGGGKGLTSKTQILSNPTKGDRHETVASWKCQSDCPVGLLDRQSGESKSTGGPIHQSGSSWKCAHQNEVYARICDAGGASRFYPQFSSFPLAVNWLMRLIGVGSAV